MDWRKYIAADPAVCHGKPCFIGTRIPVTVILDCLAADMALKEIEQDYPPVTKAHLLAALAYSAELAKERIVAA